MNEEEIQNELDREKARFTGSPTKVTKTWFLEKENGEIFPVNEKAAWNTLYGQNRNNLYSRRYKIVGVSDGKTYVEMLKQGQSKKAETEAEVAELSKTLQRYLNSLDRLKFDEFLEEDNDKVKRANKLIKETEAKLNKAQARLANIDRTIITEAYEAELEKARGNIEQPQNQDVYTPNADPVTRRRILNQLGL